MLHINPVGLAWLGGNIAVPAYSYSYTKDEVYDFCNTPSALNGVSEFTTKSSMHDIEDMMNLIAYADGSNSLLDIADLIGTPLWKLKPLLDNLIHEKLIKKS